MFVLSWTIFHVIDHASPLHETTVAELAQADALLVLNVGGLDDSSAQQLYARRVYSSDDIRSDHGYRDITSISHQGRFLLDYTKFNEVVSDV